MYIVIKYYTDKSVITVRKNATIYSKLKNIRVHGEVQWGLYLTHFTKYENLFNPAKAKLLQETCRPLSHPNGGKIEFEF